MTIVNEKVEHIKFGSGVIAEAEGNKIWVRFENEDSLRLFIYPEVFSKFMKALNPDLEKDIQEELKRIQEQIKLEQERRVQEHEAAETEKKKGKVKSKRS